jgi:GNAT superfamily N-acetyltransferase
MRPSSPDRHLVRPLRRDVGDALLDLFDRLSPLARLQRFLSPKPRLTACDLALLTDVDGDRHDALVVVQRSAPTRLLGVARLVATSRTTAELSVVVEDGWQRQGLGRRLLDGLVSRARARGIQRISGSAFADNRAALRLTQRAGRLLDVQIEDGVVELLVALEPQAA